ncbi:MAG: AAA family ATPase [Thermomicrobiales bacterium]
MARATARKPETARPAAHEPGWPAWADPRATARLQEIARGAQIGQCYLLAGPRGVGKAALARAFAQALVCERPDPDDPAQPCGECRSCRNVLRGAHPDIEVFDLAAQATLLEGKIGKGTTLTIEMVRRMRASAALLPMEASRRLLIVDDAETLLEPAQQALLKTLEEPPLTVTILLLCDQPESLLATVRSRCQEVAVRAQPEAVIADALVMRGAVPALAEEAARLSRGAAAWAVQAADEPALLQERREARSAAETWLTGSRYERLATAYRLGDQFAKRRDDVVATVQMVVQLLREEMLTIARGQSVEPDELAPSPPALASLGQALQASLQCLSDIDANVRPRLAMEAMVLAWPNPAQEAR